MKKPYRTYFWISLIILLTSNIYWFYTTIDNSVGHHYYQISCNEWKSDLEELKKTLPLGIPKQEFEELLKKRNVQYEVIKKGQNHVINFNSFEIVFDNSKKYLEIR